MSPDRAKEFEYTQEDFLRVCSLIRDLAGIALSESRQEMVYSRLARRLRTLGFTSFRRYLDWVESEAGSAERDAFTNALTTNLTSFFREPHHFPVLAAHLRLAQPPFRIWCAGCSTGEEAYSVAMTVCEEFRTIRPPLAVFATDVDTAVLDIARAGVYASDRVGKLPNGLLKRYMQRGRGAMEGQVRVRQDLRDLVEFGHLNLRADHWPVEGAFDAIFCRNVMIYFDKEMQSRILYRFAPLLKPGGLLFAGHSENFLYASDRFRARGKTVYELR